MSTSVRDWHSRASDIRPDGRPFIGGKRVNGATGETFACQSPIDGRTLAQVVRGGRADVDAAVRAARAAFDDGRWSHRAPTSRKKVLVAFADKILAAKDELALLETLDMGKPIRYSLSVDVPAAAR